MGLISSHSTVTPLPQNPDSISHHQFSEPHGVQRATHLAAMGSLAFPEALVTAWKATLGLSYVTYKIYDWLT